MKIVPKESIGIELGVFKGEFAVQLLRVTQPKELHLVDLWWVGFGEYYPDWGEYTQFGKLKTKDAYQQAVDLVDKNDTDGVAKVHVGDDLKYLSTFEDGHFDWAYIDSSHAYEHTLKELMLLKDKVNPNGIIMGHDWRPDPDSRHHGVYQAINEFCSEQGWKLIKTDFHTQWAIRRNS
ncbi:class I SAM-dependent methyltransferase [Fulvivirga sp. M361]|uniref:class I SAM-dependent methyltransferase n=1 Tax=Fulvivirga sp. M361 TaxID=2594266 RepID=UPI00162742FE|nr:class I SAM-dependent methyltransferase [Fulvivirga sp. M361]